MGRVVTLTFESFVVHFDRLDFSLQVRWSKADDHIGLENTRFDSTDRHCADTTDLVDILKWQAEWLVSGSRWRNDGIQSFQQGLAARVSFFSFDGPSFVPWHLLSRLDHVVTVPARDGDESDTLRGIADLLDVGRDFVLDFLESRRRVGWFSRVHLVDGDDHLFDTEGVGQESVFACLPVLGDTSFEFTSTRSDDQDSAISLEDKPRQLSGGSRE